LTWELWLLKKVNKLIVYNTMEISSAISLLYIILPDGAVEATFFVVPLGVPFAFFTAGFEVVLVAGLNMS
jgi:hypothetical protein